MATKTRRTQTPKALHGGRNEKFAEAMREKSRGSATSPVRSGTEYNRKPKHRARQYDY